MIYLKNKTSGFTLIEILVAISIFSLLTVASAWMIFSSLSLRDKTLATTTHQEFTRVFLNSFIQATQNAKTITGGGTSLFTQNPTDCWSFVYDSINQDILFTHISVADCTPDPSPSTSFFNSSTTQIQNLIFNIKPLVTGGREVSVNGLMSILLPFDSYQNTFSQTVVNLID